MLDQLDYAYSPFFCYPNSLKPTYLPLILYNLGRVEENLNKTCGISVTCVSHMTSKEEPTTKDITIKGLEETTYLEIKAEAVRRAKNVGELINEAMRLWLNQNVLDRLTEQKYRILGKLEKIEKEMKMAKAYSTEAYERIKQEYLDDLEAIKQKIEEVESRE